MAQSGTATASKAVFRKDVLVQIRAPALKQQKLNYMHEIQQLFRYQFKDIWMPQSFINKHNRLWINAFNTLVKGGFIEKKKIKGNTNYKWKAKFPEI